MQEKYEHMKSCVFYPEPLEESAGWTPGTGILPMMKSMTSDLWYVGKVLANEPDREDDGVGQKGFLRKRV